MKIHWTNNCQSGETTGDPSSRLAIISRLSILCAALICVFSANPGHAQSVSEGLSQAGGFSAAAAEVDGDTLKIGDESFRVVDTASYRTAADVEKSDASNVQQVGHAIGGCSTCGTSSCGGSCGGSISMPTGSCGTCGTTCGGTQGRCGLGLGSICNSNRLSGLSCQGALSNDPCAPCVPYRYASVEALYMERDDDSFLFGGSLGTLPLSDFDFEFGSRITVGAVYDCVNGYEASFVGPFDWNTSNQLPGTQTVDIQLFPSVLQPHTVGGPVLTDLRRDIEVSDQSQSLTSDYFSVDASKTINGWEMAKLLIGARYVDFGENYRYSGTMTQRDTRDPIQATGGTPTQPLNNETFTITEEQELLSSVDNQLIGLQIGLDLLYPISRFAYSDVRMRAGGYANFADVDYSRSGSRSEISNPGVFGDITRSLNDRASTDDVEIAGLFEIGTGVRYQVGEILSLRAGVELWYLSGIATATENVAGTGRSIDIDDDVLFTGISFGSELRW